MRRARVMAGAGVRLVLILAVLAILVAIPLVSIYRSTECEERGTRYSFVAPWDDAPTDCRETQSGFEVLKDEVGLE